MRTLVVLVTLVALLWSGWWVYGRSRTGRALETAQAELAAAGYSLRWDEVSTTGFPSRYDTTIERPRLVAPGEAWSWTAPFVQILSLAYRPTQLILVVPPDQGLTIGGEAVAVDAEGLRASISMGRPPALRLHDFIVESGHMRLDGATWRSEIAASLMAIRATPASGDGAGAVYDIFARATGIVPPGLAVASLPSLIDRIEIDGLMVLDRPLGHEGLGAMRPTAFVMRHVTLRWGEASATGTGRVAVGPDGTLDGRIELEIAGWEALLDAAVATGFLAPSLAPPLTLAGSLVETGGRVRLPLVLSNGQMAIGPVPLGAAPRL